MPHRCAKLPDTEVLLNSIVGSLVRENLIGHGSILDAGAKDGRWACYYATLDAKRIVHALDPDPANIREISKFSKAYRASNALHNLMPLMGLLGERSANATARDLQRRFNVGFPNGKVPKTIPIYSIDDLYLGGRLQPPPQRLSLAHLDVEGAELAVLRGAAGVVSRDRPVLITEVTVHASHKYSRALLELTSQMGYDSFVIEEITGVRADLRNLLHLPREQHAIFAASSALNIGAVTHALQAVRPETIATHAFPCCTVGGACCPPGNKARVQCCAHWRVHRWMQAALRDGSSDLQWMTRHTWYDQALLRWRPAPELLQLQQQVRSRPMQDAGFSYFTRPNATAQSDVRTRERRSTGNTRSPSATAHTHRSHLFRLGSAA